jgi:hypothetical protein
VEIRKAVRHTKDALGNDCDKLEFRYLDGSNRIEVATARQSVPSSWLVGSHISGAAFSQIVTAIRTQKGRVESPDQQLQLSQLSAIHEVWFAKSVAQTGEEPKKIKVRIATPSAQENVHLIFESQLKFMPADVVAKDALALGAHDEAISAPAVFLPPSEGSGVQVIAAAPSMVDGARGAVLPPLAIQNAVFQPDLARGVESQPIWVDNSTPLPANAPELQVVDIAPTPMDLRRAIAAKPKARAPMIPLEAIQNALDPNALSVGCRPRKADEQQRLVVVPPACQRELTAQQDLDNVLLNRKSLVDWIELNPNHVGLATTEQMICDHDIRIAELVAQIDQLRHNRRSRAFASVGFPPPRPPLPADQSAASSARPSNSFDPVIEEVFEG